MIVSGFHIDIKQKHFYLNTEHCFMFMLFTTQHKNDAITESPVIKQRNK